MFSGLIEETGDIRRQIRRGSGVSLEVAARQVLQGTRLGDSIAVNGACLTVTNLTDGSLTVDLAPETIRRTNLGSLRPGSKVNLERSLSVGSRIGGHFVQGHIDGVGSIRAIKSEGEAILAEFSAPSDIMRYVVRKGFIAVDGMSLTVVERQPDRFSVSFIPYTFAHTIVGHYQVGHVVNLEADILGKYVERFMLERDPRTGLSDELLVRYGYT